MLPLSSARRSALRSQAHPLDPVVIIGDKGLTEEVLAEIDRSLKAHELIKVRAATDARGDRRAWMATICERLAAHPIQQIGKVLVLYRENPQKKPTKRAPAEPSRTSRPRSRIPSRPRESVPLRRRPRTSR